MKKIEKGSRIPIYYQLVDMLKKDIEDGKLVVGDKLPTERFLCIKYNISRSTVRQAIGILEREGIVNRVQGSGTYVSPKKIDQELSHFYSFGDEVTKFGKKPSSEILSFKTISPTAHISKVLKLNSDEKCYRLERIRKADGEPIMYEESYIPVSRFPEMNEEYLEKLGLYGTMKVYYKVKLDYADESFSVRGLSKSEAKYLEDLPDSPCMILERVTYENSEIVEYTYSVVRGDKFRFTVKLNNI